jgi:predicted RNase H-like nuclease (RuvC/YqgF family)
VAEIKFNMPWQKLFLINNASIKLTMEGFKIKTKLKSKLNFDFATKARESLIKDLTSQLINEDKKMSPLVKKLKEYFLDTL